MILFAAALLLPAPLHAQNYSINWYTVAGGGGTSTGTSSGGNSYSISGTIGQPATATMSGGTYSLTGGFWSIISAVQIPGSPLLTITRSGTEAIISWASGSTSFVLQSTSNLAATNSWADSSATLSTNDGVVSVTVPASVGYEFYRLVAPAP